MKRPLVYTIVLAAFAVVLPLEAQLTGAQRQRILDLHNVQRCTVSPAASAMRPLVWDWRLEQVAQTYANGCAGLVHNAARTAQYNAIGGGAVAVGENITYGGGIGGSVDVAISLWSNEKPYYDYASNNCVGGICGHYTQMVWANTRRIGCGLATCGGAQMFVCNYAESGNYVGQWPYAAGAGMNASCCSRRSDFNGNQTTDLLLRNYATGSNAVWLMNGTTFTGIADLPALPNTNWRFEGSADFDGDGDTDILLRNQLTGQNAIWRLTGTALQAIVDLPTLVNLSFRFDGTGDFNADGKTDIILRNYVTGQNAVWIMNGTSFSSIVDLPALPNTSFQIEGTGDFDSDGRTDIVIRNYNSGQNAVWMMNGTTLRQIVDLPTLPNVAYRFEGAGDFNNDIRPDIVIRNPSTGHNAVWLMNGTTLSSIVDLPALPNSSFEINAPR